MRARGIWKDEDEERLDREILEEIGKAIEEVESVGPPDRSSLFEDVYATMPWHLAEQRDALEKTPLRRPPGGAGNQKDPR